VDVDVVVVLEDAKGTLVDVEAVDVVVEADDVVVVTITSAGFMDGVESKYIIPPMSPAIVTNMKRTNPETNKIWRFIRLTYEV
jgi:hypothetical protein